MLSSGHPFYEFEKTIVNHFPDAWLTFSKYYSKDYGSTAHRESIEVKSSDITLLWVENLLASLKNEQDLAVHSKIRIGENVFHIPMIDFLNINNLDLSIQELLTRSSENNKDLFEKILQKLFIYSSGRSLHGYSYILLNEEKWHKYLGDLLLLNSSSLKGIIDSRWVGHSLVNGYSALRWSLNSESYKSVPSRISDINVESFA